VQVKVLEDKMSLSDKISDKVIVNGRTFITKNFEDLMIQATDVKEAVKELIEWNTKKTKRPTWFELDFKIKEIFGEKLI